MTVSIIEETGDLFSEPSHSVLIHACNSVGSWGGGIALAFKKKYPNAFKVYHEHCTASSPDALIGTALLIPPCESSGPRHYVGCLFTSRAFGRRKDSASRILQATKPAMEQLLEDISNQGRDNIDNVVMCKINSGLFGVPWDQTRAIIECLDVDMEDVSKEIRVISPPS
jgi:ADP-ribose 1''-phosphate phosphatase